MSLLDQLSSLCVQSNFTSSFLSFDYCSSPLEIQQTRQNHQLTSQKTQHELESKRQYHHNSQQKMIKLFDDQQLKPGWRFPRTEKIISSSQQNVCNFENRLSQFTVEVKNPLKDDQAIFIRLTKMSYLMKNKLKKMNYQFFVKLQQYNKCMEKESNEKKKQIQKIQLNKIQRGADKLTQCIGIISLKYFESNNQSNSKNIQNGFQKIRSSFKLSRCIERIQRSYKKVIYRYFYVSLQQQNRKAIKIDLFQSVLSHIINKRNQLNVRSFFVRIQELKKIQQQVEIEEQANQIYYQKEVMTNKNFIEEWIIKEPIAVVKNYEIRLWGSKPLTLGLSKAANPGFMLQEGMNFSKKIRQNIPLQLHGLKTHEQQTNLPDCIDNGHLLMNQMKTNISFRQELQNLTISNINSRTANSSLNSSSAAYDNLILPTFNNDMSDRSDKQAINMRKPVKPQQNNPKPHQSIIKDIKKPRKSLVITKRKQSLNQPHTFYDSERQTTQTYSKKPNSTTTSQKKIPEQTKNVANDRENIRKMLEELNEKFSCKNKVTQISLSNKMQHSAQKKQSIVSSSGKKMDRNKIKSQIGLKNNFEQKSCHKESNQRSDRQQFKIDLVDKSNQISQQRTYENINYNQKEVQKCIIAVNPNENSTQNKLRQNEQQICQSHKQRMKQSRSQLSKKNMFLLSQCSEDNDICKILSKYRTKKSSLPQSGIKISLISSSKDSISQIMRNQYTNDSLLIKKCSDPQLSSDSDSAIGQYADYLSSDIYLKQNQDKADYLQYESFKPSQRDNNSIENSEHFFNSPHIRMPKQKMGSSMQKKRSSFEKSAEEWDSMFEKQKGKFLKNKEWIKMPKRKSILNQEMISEIKQKIQQCLILSQKDPNALKRKYSSKKSSNESLGFGVKNLLLDHSSRHISQQGSKRNSVSTLYAAGSKYKKQQP